MNRAIYFKKKAGLQKDKIMYFYSSINQQFYYIGMNKKSGKRLSTIQNKQILPPVRNTKIKTENTLNTSLFYQEKPHQINIPISLKNQISQAHVSRHASDYFKNNRTNIRQLNNFLKHQAIFIRQKEQVITNLPPKTRQENDLKQLRQKMVRMLSLKSSINIDSSQIIDSPFRKINKIELPQMEDMFKKAQSIRIRKNTASVLSNQNRLKNKSSINKYTLVHEKKKNVQHFPTKYKFWPPQEQPLIIASSKKLSQLGLNPESNIKKKEDASGIADFKRFKNNSRLSKLSLRLVTEFSQNSNKIQHHLSCSP